MTTYRAVGSHGIRVTSGDFQPGDTGIVLTESEAWHLQRAGAVEEDTQMPPAAALPVYHASDPGLTDDDEE